MTLYRSPHEAYPYLAEPAADLRCDFELATDSLAVEIGMLQAQVEDPGLRVTLAELNDLVMHLNPSLRMGVKITEAERARLEARVLELSRETPVRGFVATEGTPAAVQAHRLRCAAKRLVRLIYRYLEQAGPDALDAADLKILLDVPNLLSGYFFFLALSLNRAAGRAERPFVSRHYTLDGSDGSDGSGASD